MIRQFSLENSIGQQWDLNSLDSFAYNPTGLGATFDAQYIPINSNFLTSSINPNQTSASMQILFGADKSNSYQKYFEFVKFINYSPLTFIYETDAGIFKRTCIVGEMTKSELNNFSVLDETFTINFLTPWYKYIEKSGQESEFTDNASKIYRQAGIESSNLNFLPDSQITSFGENWATSGSIYAWHIQTDNQYIPGYNIAILNQNEVQNGNVSVFSQRLNANNINITGQSDLLLLDFYFKSDIITESNNNIEVSANDETAAIIDIADDFGVISQNKAIYRLDSKYSGEWLECKIVFEGDIQNISFNFPATDSKFNYFTAPKLLFLDSIQNTDAYYIYDFVYENSKKDINNNYYNLVNNSVYFASSSGSPIEITIESLGTPVINPSWELWQGSNIIQSDRYFLTIEPGYKLIVSSFPENQYARLVAPDNTFTNVYQYQDLTKTNFITIPVGSSTLTFNVGDGRKFYRMREEYIVV